MKCDHSLVKTEGKNVTETIQNCVGSKGWCHCGKYSAENQEIDYFAERLGCASGTEI